MSKLYFRIASVVIAIVLIVWMGAALLSKAEQAIDTRVQQRQSAISQIP